MTRIGLMVFEPLSMWAAYNSYFITSSGLKVSSHLFEV